MIKWLKRIFYSGVALLLLVLLLNYKVKHDVKESMYDNITETPSKKVGLLLGTAKYVKGGWINLYYKHRITAAVELYKAGKIEYILISGDNGRESYDEPTLMKEDRYCIYPLSQELDRRLLQHRLKDLLQQLQECPLNLK